MTVFPGALRSRLQNTQRSFKGLYLDTAVVCRARITCSNPTRSVKTAPRHLAIAEHNDEFAHRESPEEPCVNRYTLPAASFAHHPRLQAYACGKIFPHTSHGRNLLPSGAMALVLLPQRLPCYVRCLESHESASGSSPESKMIPGILHVARFLISASGLPNQ